MTRYDALVIGADSLVGAELVLALRAAGYAVRATSRRLRPDALHLDLARPDLPALARERFACAFVCAGMTQMEACERAPEEAHLVNVENTLKIMRALARAGTHLVFFSSGQVFDGEIPRPGETAPRRPKNRYGRHKLEVEEAIAPDPPPPGEPAPAAQKTRYGPQKPEGEEATPREPLPAAVLRIPKTLAREPVG